MSPTRIQVFRASSPAPSTLKMSAVPQNSAEHVPDQRQTRTEADELYGGRPLAGRCSGLCHPGASMREKMGTQRRS